MHRIPEAAAVLKELPRESAILQLPLFVSLLCEKDEISAITDIDFGVAIGGWNESQSLQSDIQRQLLLACGSHHPDSTVFLSTHALLVHQKQLALSLLPLHLLLQKLQALSPSSPKQYCEVLLREFRVLGLMLSVLDELPKSARILDAEGVLLDEAAILRWMTELEVSMSALQEGVDPQQQREQKPEALVQSLLSRGQFVLCCRLVDVLRFDGEMVASVLARWVAEKLRAAPSTDPFRGNVELSAEGCASLLRMDPTGKMATAFARTLLAENPAAPLPPFVDRALEALMERGSCAYSAVAGELLRLGRLEEACRLLVAAMERPAVWVSPSLVQLVKCCFEKVAASEKLSEPLKRRVKCRGRRRRRMTRSVGGEDEAAGGREGWTRREGCWLVVCCRGMFVFKHYLPLP